MYDQRELEMFHIVYKITNTINNKTYIGKHSTKDLDDGYLGSGLYIKRAVKRYGIEKFKKEILFIYDTPEAALLKEKELVTEEFKNRKDTYNLKIGGRGGFDYINENKLSPDKKDSTYAILLSGTTQRISIIEYRKLKALGQAKHHTDNTVAIVRNGKKMRISKEEFDAGNDVGHTFGKSYALNTITNRTEYVDNTDLRWKTGELIGNQKDKSWYNDGNKNYFKYSRDSVGLTPGRINMKSVKGKKWYHSREKAYHLFPNDQRILTLNLKLGRAIK